MARPFDVTRRAGNPGTQRGFTLLELMVVTGVIGILVAIAIPQYSEFRARGYDADVQTTVRNVATAEEAFFTSHLYYTANLSELDGLVVPDDLTISVTAGNSGDLTTSFAITGSHPMASHSYTWISDPGPGEPNFSKS